MNMFDQMLAIKRFREQQAELEFIRQRLRRTEAEQETEKAQDRLNEFRDWAREREAAMYDDLCERVVRVREIEGVLYEVSQLRKDEGYYESVLHKANDTLEEETHVLSERRQAHMQTVRMSNKFVELANVYHEGETQIRNNKEDLELEEVASLVRDRVDWNDENGGDPQ